MVYRQLGLLQLCWHLKPFFQNVSLGVLGAKSPAAYYSTLIKPASSGSTDAVFVREISSSGGKVIHTGVA